MNEKILAEIDNLASCLRAARLGSLQDADDNLFDAQNSLAVLRTLIRMEMEPVEMKPNALIVGGSSGLGLELAKRLMETHQVTITGRKDPQIPGLPFIYADLKTLPTGVSNLRGAFPPGSAHFNLFVYAAGYFQEGHIDDLTDEEIIGMGNVGLIAPAVIMSWLLAHQGGLDGYIAITSTSGWTARELEPVYTGVKAGLGLMSKSFSLDPRIKKTLVAGPAGMKTPFWDGTDRDTAGMLDVTWVADEILKAFNDTTGDVASGGPFKYKFVKFARMPQRVIVEEII